MSPGPFARAGRESADLVVRRFWISLGQQVRATRHMRRIGVAEIAKRAGVSRDVIYTLERGEAASIEAVGRVVSALGLRLEVDLVDPRKRADRAVRAADPVHSFMGEFEATHLGNLSVPTGIDEPYQHYQFAGRADVIAWDLAARALLHLENRTRFPDLQDTAGSFNSKRAYLGEELGKRLGVSRWASETHVMVALWSAEVLHSLRLRPQSFRSVCPDSADSFAAWWAGNPPTGGRFSTLVVLDPLATSRQRQWLGLDDALVGARPRYRGYADAVARMGAAA